jgi:hypothetical protein
MAWVFIANITDKFTLWLDVLLTHDASLDLRNHLWLWDEEMPFWRKSIQQSWQCGWNNPWRQQIALKWWVPRLPIKLKQEGQSSPVPVTLTGDHQTPKHIKESVPIKELWHSRQIALRREQLQNSSARSNPRGRKAGRHWSWKQHQSQQDVEMPSVRMITDVTGTFPQMRWNGDMPVDYSGRAASRRKQCDTMIERTV